MAELFSSYESKLRAVNERNPDAEGHFVYCVTSTMICCRPTCYSRLPLTKNIEFCDTFEEAAKMGFRMCKRCKPEQEKGWNKTRESVAKGCLLLSRAAKAGIKPDIDAIAQLLGSSKWHFCRQFKNYTGHTPRKFYLECAKGSDPLKNNALPLIRTKKYMQRLRNEKKAAQKDNSPEMSSPSDFELLTPDDILNYNFDDIDAPWLQEDSITYGAVEFEKLFDAKTTDTAEPVLNSIEQLLLIGTGF